MATQDEPFAGLTGLARGLIVFAVGILIVRGLNVSVEFTGGTVMELAYPQAASLPEVRKTVTELGFDDAQVQTFGISRDVLIRLPLRDNESTAQFSEELAMRNATPVEVIDNAITRTMSRTIIAHGSTQIFVLSMRFFGGPTLIYFALALTIGILFGIKREDLIKPVKNAVRSTAC